MKGNLLVVNLTWSLPIKAGSLQVFGHIVGCITAGQAGNTAGQDVKGNQQGSYRNRQSGKCLGQACFISLTHGLPVMVFVSIKGESARGMDHLDFQLLQITTGSVEIGLYFWKINLGLVHRYYLCCQADKLLFFTNVALI